MGCDSMAWELTGWITLACIIFTPIINGLIRLAGAMHMTRWLESRKDKP